MKACDFSTFKDPQSYTSRKHVLSYAAQKGMFSSATFRSGYGRKRIKNFPAYKPRSHGEKWKRRFWPLDLPSGILLRQDRESLSSRSAEFHWIPACIPPSLLQTRVSVVLPLCLLYRIWEVGSGWTCLLFYRFSQKESFPDLMKSIVSYGTEVLDFRQEALTAWDSMISLLRWEECPLPWEEKCTWILVARGASCNRPRQFLPRSVIPLFLFVTEASEF